MSSAKCYHHLHFRRESVTQRSELPYITRLINNRVRVSLCSSSGCFTVELQSSVLNYCILIRVKECLIEEQNKVKIPGIRYLTSTTYNVF